VVAFRIGILPPPGTLKSCRQKYAVLSGAGNLYVEPPWRQGTRSPTTLVIEPWGIDSSHFTSTSWTAPDRAALCTSSGCLHQVYISADGAYRLVFSANVSDTTLKFLDHAPAIEIDCERFGPQDCPHALRWNGRRFASPGEHQQNSARLKAIEPILPLAFDTRRPYLDVVVVHRLSGILELSRPSAEPRAEQAKKVGGIDALNKLDQVREDTFYADISPFSRFVSHNEPSASGAELSARPRPVWSEESKP